MKSFFLLSFLLLTITLTAQKSPYRRILIFTPDTFNTAYLNQNKILKKDVAGCVERDIVIENYVLGKSGKHFFDKYQVSLKEFTFLLIGKDGLVRLRSKEIMTSERIYAIIDAMPMRKDEILKKQKQK